MKNQLLVVGEEAGCPFKHHSRASLQQLVQPCSEFVLRNICSLVDAGDYSGACCLHLESLTSKSCSDICSSRIRSSSHTAVKSMVCETVGGQQTDMEVEETSDSGYDSAQSYQPVQENNCTSLSSSQTSESIDVDNRVLLNKTSMSSSAQNTEMSHAHHRCIDAVVLPSKLDDCGVCNVQEHIIGSDCDIVSRKLHAPVDFYTSFNCLVTGLQSRAAS